MSNKRKIKAKSKLGFAGPGDRVLKCGIGLGGGFGGEYVDVPLGMPVEREAAIAAGLEFEDTGDNVVYVTAIFPICDISFEDWQELVDDGLNPESQDFDGSPETYKLNQRVLGNILSPGGWRNLYRTNATEIVFNPEDRAGMINMLSRAWEQAAFLRMKCLLLTKQAVVSDQENLSSGSAPDTADGPAVSGRQSDSPESTNESPS